MTDATNNWMRFQNPAEAARAALNFMIPEHAWTDASESDAEVFDPKYARTRLYASLSINGVLFHCEAIEAETFEDGGFRAVNPDWDETLDDYYAACGCEGPMKTIEIQGRQYAVFLTPGS